MSKLDAQAVRRDGADRVARDDDGLHLAGYEALGAPERVLDDRRGAARAVRHPRRVAEVDDALVRQRLA